MYRLDEEEEEEENGSNQKVRSVNTKIDDVLLKARRIFFCEPVDMNSAKDVIRKLWYMELTNPGKPILFVINSPGGAIDAGLAIWDQVKMISSPVSTLVTGLAASMGSVLSLCAAPKRRFATPNARIMIHQPRLGGLVRGQATDLAIQAKEMIRTRKALIDLYVEATGKDVETITAALERDTWMTPQEAKEFGLVDKVVTSFDEIF